MAEEDSKTPNAPLHRRNSRIALSENIKQFRPEFHTELKGEDKAEKLWNLMAEYIPVDKSVIQKSIISRCCFVSSTINHRKYKNLNKIANLNFNQIFFVYLVTN